MVVVVCCVLRCVVLGFVILFWFYFVIVGVWLLWRWCVGCLFVYSGIV